MSNIIEAFAMTNEQRLDALNKAIGLIRNVEFSYPNGSEERKLLYRFVVNNFSLTGEFMGLYQTLQEKVDDETDTSDEGGTYER